MNKLPVARSGALTALAVFFGFAFSGGNDILCAGAGLLFLSGLAFLFEFFPELRWRELWLSGGLGLTFVFSWTPRVLGFYAGWPPYLGLLTLLLFAAVGALQFAIAIPLERFFRRGPAGRCALSLPLAWTCGELFFPKMIPWSCGHAFAGVPGLPLLASIFGVQAISFVLLWWSALLIGEARGKSGHGSLFLLSFTVVLVMVLFENARLARTIANAEGISIGFIQSNLDPQQDYTLDRREASLQVQRELAREVLKGGPVDLLVWPESAVGFTFSPGEDLIPPGSGKQPFPGYDAPLLFGGQTIAQEEGLSLPAYLITAFLLEPGGHLHSYYKQRLIPFAEQIPFETRIRSLRGFHRRPYALLAGPKPSQPMVLRRGEKPEATLGLGICYEDLFAETYFGTKANILVSLSNDSWFLDSRAPWQHNQVARFQAVHFGRYLIRATTNGISSVIAPSGAMLFALPRGEPGIGRADSIPLLSHSTLYGAVGGYPLMAVMFVFAALAVVTARPSVSHRGSNGPEL